MMAWAHFFAGHYDEAVLWAGRALQDQPNFLPALRVAAASHALAGRSHEAHQAIARLRQLDPSASVSTIDLIMGPLKRQQDRLQLAEGLRKAGLPE